MAGRSFPTAAYVSAGGGASNRAGKQSSLDRRYDKHLRPHDSVGTGEGEVVGPAKVAGGREGSWADQTWCGTVEGPATEGPA